MSDTTTLSHEYETSASFAESVNQAVLKIKKARLGRPGVSGAERDESCARLAALLDAIVVALSTAGRCAKAQEVPGEVLERLVAKHGNRLSYFQTDLVQTAGALRGKAEIDADGMKVLEEISDAADATASASFRRLRRR